MGYLLLGLIIGFISDRYILPVSDMFLELISHKVNKAVTSIQIDTGLMSIDYQEIADQGQPQTPTIGFHSDIQYDDEEYDDDEEDQRDRSKKIGFIK